MDKKETIQRLNNHPLPFFEDMGGKTTDADPELGTCVMEFDISEFYCHSGDIVQGGFVTAMLDLVTSHAVFATDPLIVGLSTLELKVSFYAASRAGKFRAFGKIEKKGKSIVFLSGDLYNESGERTASITSTSKFYIKK